MCRRGFDVQRQRGDHDRARDLLHGLGQLLDEGDGLIREARIACRNGRRTHAVADQLVQRDQARRRGLQNLEEYPLRHALALIVSTGGHLAQELLDVGVPVLPLEKNVPCC